MASYNLSSLLEKIDTNLAQERLTESINVNQISSNLSLYLYDKRGQREVFENGEWVIKTIPINSQSGLSNTKIIGVIGWKNVFSAHIFEIHSEDMPFIHLAKPLVAGEMLFRYYTDISKINGLYPIVKINFYKGEICFFDNDTDPLVVRGRLSLKYAHIYKSVLGIA